MRRTIWATGVAITIALGALLPTGLASADEPVPGKLLLMLDASGSMKAKDPSGLTKIEAAKKALTGVVGALPDTAQVGLRVYGAKVDGKGKPTPAACADTQLIHPIAALDKTRLTSTIAAIKALGETPIAHSLEEAMKDLGTEGKRNIVLVSDGEESCVPDPCPTVKKLTAAGVDLQIDTVGFGVDAKARKQLQCIADAGRGTYYDAKNADALAGSLSKLSQRALRPFTVDGTPITVTEEAAQAPVIRPGRYTDTLTVSPTARYVRLARTPGSVPHLSLVARPGSAGRENTDSESWVVTLSTPDGTECDREYDASIEFFRSGAAMTVSVSANNSNAGKPEPDAASACATSPELVGKIEHDKGAGSNAVQFVYVEEPPATNVASLPEGVDPAKVEPFTAKASGTPKPVVGGGGFGDAPTLAPGTYEETILPGEQLVYRVPVDFGQRAAFTADIGTTGPKPEFGGTDYNLFTVDAWTPALFRITRAGGSPDNRESLGRSKPSLSLTEFVPEVRYRNKTVIGNGYHYPALREVSLPGYYYFAVNRAAEDKAELQGPVTVRLNVAVEGEVTGKPAYAGTAPEASTSPSVSGEPTTGPSKEDAVEPVSREDDPSPFGWIFGGLIAVLGLGAAAAGLLRRKGSGSNDTLVAEDDQPGGGSQA